MGGRSGGVGSLAIQEGREEGPGEVGSIIIVLEACVAFSGELTSHFHLHLVPCTSAIASCELGTSCSDTGDGEGEVAAVTGSLSLFTSVPLAGSASSPEHQPTGLLQYYNF